MRLLHRSDDDELRLTNDIICKEVIPPYAILSHTWEEGQEVAYQDFADGNTSGKSGYEKLSFRAEKSKEAGLSHFWVDTCCIDKRNSVELQEAIESMYRWYSNAEICFVYLADVEFTASWDSAIRKSRWFTRGWTLQELLAPRRVEFYTKDGYPLGSKRILEDMIHEITGIDRWAIQGRPLQAFSVEERMSRASRRNTKREKDAAYSLFGIFRVHMPLIYGEGRTSAFKRLKAVIESGQSIVNEVLMVEQAKQINREWEQQMKRRDTLIKSLSFSEIHARQTTIKAPYARTCEWLLSQPQYVDWQDPARLPFHHGFLWMKAKPGAGKSTLTKFISDQLRTIMTNSHVVVFFFNARGNVLESSILGAYRSILWQILKAYPGVTQILDMVAWDIDTTAEEIKVPWDVNALQALISRAIVLLGQVSLYCFIDALDESEEQQVSETIDFLEHLGTLAVPAGVALKTCLSSRHYPYITVREGISLILDNNPGHSGDITSYLESALRIERTPFAQRIRANIQARASGVFMWVVLVVSTMNREYDHGRVHCLQKKA